MITIADGIVIIEITANFEIKTKSIKVCNVSRGASEHDIKEFFSYSGEIEHVELHSENEQTQTAYVSFKDSQGAETAALLSGATIADQPVTIALAPDFKAPISEGDNNKNNNDSNNNNNESAVHTAQEVVSTMLAKGFILGKDAANKAKELDEKHQLMSTASAKMAVIDQKIGLSEKISAGSSIVSDKMKEVDEKYQVKEKTKTALAVAEQKVSDASSAVMKNRYVLTGATWAAGAYTKVAKAAEEVGQKTREKMAEEEKGRINAPGDQSQTQTPAATAAADTSEQSLQPMTN